MKSKKIYKSLCTLVILCLYVYFEYDNILHKSFSNEHTNQVFYNVESIPEYSGEDVIVLNNNEPEFDISNIDITKSFELYGELDSLGRCTSAISNIGSDLMPTKERGSIQNIRPTGFKVIKYSIIKNGLYLYNRCHLIGYQLTGENDNVKNLITCTRHMNATLMEPYESEIADYIIETNNHVLYRVTPIFDDFNLVAKGIQMEALSLEDNGKGIKFNIFIYNVQPGIIINYENGDSKLEE